MESPVGPPSASMAKRIEAFVAESVSIANVPITRAALCSAWPRPVGIHTARKRRRCSASAKAHKNRSAASARAADLRRRLAGYHLRNVPEQSEEGQHDKEREEGNHDVRVRENSGAQDCELAQEDGEGRSTADGEPSEQVRLAAEARLVPSNPRTLDISRVPVAIRVAPAA